jgi:hypothetical protein
MMKANFHKRMIKSVSFIGLFCTLLIIVCTSEAMAQNNIVSGKVTDAQTGEALPGVNILVMGTSMGTATDAQGHYSLNVPSLQDTLRFSFIGYQSQVVPINGRTRIDVTLKPTVISGNQMVVVGFGTTKKKDLTGSVTHVNSKEIEAIPTFNVAQALIGHASGVQVVHNSG